MKILRAKVIQTTAMLLGAAFIAGCGGGGGGSGPQAAASGSLDKSFDTDGMVTMGVTKQDGATDIIAQNDGTLLVTGYLTRTATDEDGALAKFDNSGKLVSTFGTQGAVISSLLRDDTSNAMVTDSNGNIYLAGYLTNNASKKQLVIAKYKPDGTPDTTFGTNGAFVMGSGVTANAIALTTGNKVVVAGEIENSSTDYDIYVLRLTTGGSLDPAFGGGSGYVVLNTTKHDTANDLVIDSNKKILVVGKTKKNNGDKDVAIARFNENGTLDTSFGTNGIVTLNSGNGNDEGNAIVTDSNGKIVITGNSANAMAVARFNQNGTLDTNFGTNGVITGTTGMKSIGHDLTIDANDNIIVTGIYVKSLIDYRMAVWRFDTTGNPDTTFGTNGLATDGSAISGGFAITLDSNNKIVVAGMSHQGPTQQVDMAIWRINP